jgi:hypothetical protein
MRNGVIFSVAMAETREWQGEVFSCMPHGM